MHENIIVREVRQWHDYVNVSSVLYPNLGNTINESCIEAVALLNFIEISIIFSELILRVPTKYKIYVKRFKLKIIYEKIYVCVQM